jgi:hypothetical protein
MASISQIAVELRSAAAEIVAAQTAASAADAAAEALHRSLLTAGMEASATDVGTLRQTVERLTGHLAAGRDMAAELILQALAIGGGSLAGSGIRRPTDPTPVDQRVLDLGRAPRPGRHVHPGPPLGPRAFLVGD